VAGAAALGVVLLRSGSAPREDGCSIAAGAGSYSLDLPQAANAATIAAVAIRSGLSDHAVTIALATALQESKLHNLPYGDLDSVGLFQQRPSQGWGRRSDLLDPHYAARAFFAHLERVHGWQTMPVATAAQAVQRSAAGSAYADWEPEARAVAQALTGEVPRGIACFYNHTSASSRGLDAAVSSDLGPGAIESSVTVKRGWMVASWLVAQAAQYRISTVTYDGQRWTRATGRWARHPTPAVVRYAVETG
jgi:hypothetical protein